MRVNVSAGLLCSILGLPFSARALDYVTVVSNTPNLLGYWRFDPVFQTNSCVNGYTGALDGAARIGPPGSGCPLPLDPTNQSLLLDGSSGYMMTSLTGQITNQGSVCLWEYLTNQPSVAGHIFQITSEADSGNDFDFQIQTDNNVYFFTDNGSSTEYPHAIPVNQWHFLAATFVANTSRAIYLDGQQVASSVPGSHSLDTSAFTIGNNLVFGPRLFEGRVCEVAVFSRALAASEISAMYQAAGRASLSIASISGAVVLSWPTNFSLYNLATNSTLNINGWSEVGSSYIVVGTNFVFTNPLSPAGVFFRLQYP